MPDCAFEMVVTSEAAVGSYRQPVDEWKKMTRGLKGPTGDSCWYVPAHLVPLDMLD